MNDISQQDSGSGRGGVEAWFPSSRAQALQDLWVVYDKHYDTLTASTRRVIERNVEFGPIFRAAPPEQMASNSQRARELLGGAIGGDWGAYEEFLRLQGTLYARLGVSFAAWSDLLKALHVDVIPLLVETYVSTPARLIAALVTASELIDRAMVTIAGPYMETKEELIREAESLHTLIFDSALDPIIASDEHGVITAFNPAAERTFGHARAQALGQKLSELLIAPRFRGEYDRGLGRYLSDMRGPVVGKRIELVAVRADGRELPVEVTTVARETAGGGYVFKSFMRDLGDLRKGEQSRALWAKVFEQAQFGIAIWEAQSGRLHSANLAYATLLGYDPEEIIGGKVEQVVPADPPADGPDPGRGAQERGYRTYETRLRRKDGSSIRVLVSTSVLPAWAGESPLRVSTVIDASERLELERALARTAQLAERSRKVEEASRLKSEFLANMSHELRTPLNAIIGFSELLHDGAVGPVGAKQKEFLNDILGSGKHLQQLINDILDLSKVEAGKMEFFPELLSLSSVVNEVLSILRPTAARKSLHLETDLAPESEHVTLDPGRLKQVLYNYVSNALKFTPEHGKIVVRTRTEGLERFRIEVEDTGVGIAPEEITRLFTEFQQLDGGAAKKHQGTGLGLALTRRLVEAQGGTVGITSTPGVGSTFFAVLPRKTVRTPAAGRTRIVAGSSPHAAAVLVVEDDAADQEVLVTALHAAGFSVEAVATGADAIARCRERSFDALTLDVLLPDMSGFDVLKAVRSQSRNVEVPVVVITVVTEKIAAGFVVQDVLPKPIEPADVVAALERHIVPRSGRRSVLVVDDDPGSLKLMATTLQELGCQARCFSDAQAALTALDAESEGPAVLVLDLMLPGMDGFTFLREFRRREHCSHVPVLVWTVKDLTSEERDKLLSNAQAIITKGKDRRGTLLATLADHLAVPAPASQEANRAR
jgi:PAS domain S-box-containing protein